VLLEVYAKGIEGQHEAAKRRVDEALGWPSSADAVRGHALDTDGRGWPLLAGNGRTDVR
jgi:hypothetical protein